jgi:hypothetical protein
VYACACVCVCVCVCVCMCVCVQQEGVLLTVVSFFLDHMHHMIVAMQGHPGRRAGLRLAPFPESTCTCVRVCVCVRAGHMCQDGGCTIVVIS